MVECNTEPLLTVLEILKGALLPAVTLNFEGGLRARTARAKDEATRPEAVIVDCGAETHNQWHNGGTKTGIKLYKNECRQRRTRKPDKSKVALMTVTDPLRFGKRTTEAVCSETTQTSAFFRSMLRDHQYSGQEADRYQKVTTLPVFGLESSCEPIYSPR